MTKADREVDKARTETETTPDESEKTYRALERLFSGGIGRLDKVPDPETLANLKDLQDQARLSARMEAQGDREGKIKVLLPDGRDPQRARISEEDYFRAQPSPEIVTSNLLEQSPDTATRLAEEIRARWIERWTESMDQEPQLRR